MRIVAGYLLVAACAAAQTPVRGILLECDPQTVSGQFSIRAADNQVFRYRFDGKTYVERENASIDVTRLQPGEKVEVVSDAVEGSQVRYARTVHVLMDAPAPRLSPAGRYRAATRRADDRMLPTGTLTFSGVVFRINPERLVLHTRTGGEQSILLRKDTRYLHNGELGEAETLPLNTRVFVRAGKDLYDQVEAYQVVWGAILEPK